MNDPRDAPVRYSDDANLEPDELEAAEVPEPEGAELSPPEGTELLQEEPKGTELDGDGLVLGPGERAAILVFGSITFEIKIGENAVVIGLFSRGF